ncbi:MAG: outer membrane protein assembly factor BamD [Verrucomicrobiales bacterium]|nr:outer membrane protein assembly factor BamD [Verrucomicrobiales bacterium]
MRFRSLGVLLLLLAFWLTPQRAPAPLIYRPGEGWTYESEGGGKWRRNRAKDQLEVAQEAFDGKKFNTAIKAAKRVVAVWPLSDYAPRAQYLLGRAYEERGRAERAFKAYQTLIERFPKIDNYEEILKRQFDIATLYLNGKWFYLWGVIPAGPDRDKTVDMYEKLIRSGPYSTVAPEAQMNIGTAREKQREWMLAVRAYERAADRYHDQAKVAAEALYRAGMAHLQEAEEAEYDQSAAVRAINSFTDFIALFPEEPRVPEAKQHITDLYRVRADGSYRIARYYEKKRRLDGAVVYYAEVVDLYTRLVNEPDAPRVQEARRRISEINARRAKSSGGSVPATPVPAPAGTNAVPASPTPPSTPAAK